MSFFLVLHNAPTSAISKCLRESGVVYEEHWLVLCAFAEVQPHIFRAATGLKRNWKIIKRAFKKGNERNALRLRAVDINIKPRPTCTMNTKPPLDYSNSLNLWDLSQTNPPIFLVMPGQCGPTAQQVAQDIQQQRDLRYQKMQEKINQLKREKAEGQALAQRKAKKGPSKAPDTGAIVANAFFPSSRTVAGHSQQFPNHVPPSSEAIANARAIEQAGMAVTNTESKNINKIKDALAENHMYDNEYKAITNTELTCLLIARDTYDALPEKYHLWMQKEDEAYTSVLHLGAGEGRSNFINCVKENQQDIFLEAFTNVLDGRKITGHDPATQCREHIMMMCPCAAALLFSCRTDNLLEVATGRMLLLTEKDDIAYHALIGPATFGGRTSTVQASASPADTKVDSDSSGDNEPVERIVHQLLLNLVEEEEADLDDGNEDEDEDMEDSNSNLPAATLPPPPVKALGRKKAAPAIAAEERPVAGPSQPKPKPVKLNLASNSR
ncbi:hypothetical protein CYLTODRAFT_415839 [Cylindrobasidium torrendii FP15055 ss-10]|uniref:Uncharacterized protein n=1 Tax=Cylindrobasidium torrendii FP15055 ss-10 TaxID=1314674 RepID=A0A0D7ASS0_9AGAR|nr:hypothetical protein CYLTODRAFT_415839 [Cylindrobasidium torrendii FP15055 ss-10]